MRQQRDCLIHAIIVRPARAQHANVIAAKAISIPKKLMTRQHGGRVQITGGLSWMVHRIGAAVAAAAGPCSQKSNKVTVWLVLSNGCFCRADYLGNGN